MAFETKSLLGEMIRINAGDPRRIQHLIKVHAFARQIGALEGIPDDMMEVLEVAALTHDIGIRYCENKYGHCTGKLQETGRARHRGGTAVKVGICPRPD